MANANSTEITTRYDCLSKDLSAAKAILDAAKVLTALERSRAEAKDGCLATGGGYANGHVLRDDTLPTMLSHAADLVAMADNEADCLRETALNVLAQGPAGPRSLLKAGDSEASHD